MSATGARLSRDLALAEKAYALQDSNMSRIAHGAHPYPQRQHHPEEDLDLDEDLEGRRMELADEGHFKNSGVCELSFLKGANRGVTVSVLTVCALFGAQVSQWGICVLASGVVVCFALSEGIERFVHNHYKMEYKLREAQREYWELENYPEGECREMVELYTENGIDVEDAKVIISRMSKYPGFFVNHMLVEELGMLPPKLDVHPLADCNSFYTNCSYIYIIKNSHILCFRRIRRRRCPVDSICISF